MVVAVEFSVPEVVGAHYGPGAAFLNGSLEGREVDLVHGSVIHHGVGGGASHLLVVHGKVLYACGNPVLLDSLHIRYNHLGGKIGVFAHILKGAAPQRSAADIDAGAKQDVFFAVAGFLADAVSVQCAHFPVPGGGEVNEGRECGAGVVGPAGLVPVVPKDLRTDAVRTVRVPKFRDSKPWYAGAGELGLGVGHGHFLLKGHLGEGILHLFFQ